MVPGQGGEGGLHPPPLGDDGQQALAGAHVRVVDLAAGEGGVARIAVLGGQAGPVHPHLAVVVQGHFDDARLQEHLPLGPPLHFLQVGRHPPLGGRIGAHRHQAAAGLDEQGAAAAGVAARSGGGGGGSGGGRGAGGGRCRLALHGAPEHQQHQSVFHLPPGVGRGFQLHRGRVGRAVGAAAGRTGGPRGSGAAAGPGRATLGGAVHLVRLAAGAGHGQLVQVVEAQVLLALLHVEVAALAAGAQAQARQHLVQQLVQGGALEVQALHAGVQPRLEDQVQVGVGGGRTQDVPQVRLAHGDVHGSGRGLGPEGGDQEQHGEQAGAHHGEPFKAEGAGWAFRGMATSPAGPAATAPLAVRRRRV